MVIDEATEVGARVAARLRDELVAWLVTVAADGTPVPTPVWFLWDGESILVYSQPDKPKLRHIAVHPRVAVALRTDELGDEHHIVLSGRVRITQGETTVDAGPGDYVLLDGTLPHDAESVGSGPARLIIVYPRGGHSELTRRTD